MKNYSLEYAAGYLDISRRQLNNQIGSGKIMVEVTRNERRISEGELERIERLRDIDPDFYIVWKECEPRYINTRYATHLLGPGFSQEYLVDLFNRGAVRGRKIGNVVELERKSLEQYVSERRWGQPFKLPLDVEEKVRPAVRLCSSGAGR